MPKSCDAAYCRVCAEAILGRVAAVVAQVGPVRKATDIEAVHDMRVASRRLRAALALVEPCLPAQAGTWQKAIRKVTRALGRARDLDVQIATVESIKAKQRRAAWGPGLQRLLDSLRARRQAAQGKVAKALSRLADSGVLAEMEDSLSGLARAMPVTGADWKKAYRLAAKAIRRLLDDLQSYARHLARPRAVEQHHAMRIAAKRLRYSLEVFEPLYGQALAPALRSAKKMQTLLGELHDCDEWLASLPEFLSDQRGRPAGRGRGAEELARGIEAFRKDRLRRRQTLFRQCLKYWRKCRKERTWPRLRQTLDQTPAKAPSPPPRQTAPAADA